MSKLLPILLYPHDGLRTTAKDIEQITPDIKTLVQNMFYTMYKSKGIGLAATQVGELKNLFVMDVGIEDESTPKINQNTEEDDDSLNIIPNPLVFINPRITSFSKELFEYEEGCLSMPKMRGMVKRPQTITLEYLDIDGNTQTLTAQDLMSTCIQHEIDHLHGILFFDHLSRLKREMLLKKYQKEQQALKSPD